IGGLQGGDHRRGNRRRHPRLAELAFVDAVAGFAGFDDFHTLGTNSDVTAGRHHMATHLAIVPARLDGHIAAKRPHGRGRGIGAALLAVGALHLLADGHGRATLHEAALLFLLVVALAVAVLRRQDAYVVAGHQHGAHVRHHAAAHQGQVIASLYLYRLATDAGAQREVLFLAVATSRRGAAEQPTVFALMGFA